MDHERFRDWLSRVEELTAAQRRELAEASKSIVGTVVLMLEALSRFAWPAVTLVVLFVLAPKVLEALPDLKSLTIRFMGAEVTLQEVIDDQQALINTINQGLIDIQSSNGQTAGGTAEKPNLYAKYLAINTFTGGDLELQKSLRHLGDDISRIIDRGLAQGSIEQARQLIITQHNAAWSFVIDEENVGKHIEGSEGLYQFLTKILIDSSPNNLKGKFASALGVMKNNMRGRISSLRTN